MNLAEHPTVKRIRSKQLQIVDRTREPLDANWLRQFVLDAGANDVGFVQIERQELDDQRDDILRVFPRTKALISFVVRMNRGPVRTPARSVANLEFHHKGEHVNDVGRSVVGALEERGIAALNPAMGFPMEVGQFPGKIWVVSHKPVAMAAGLGMMGIHRNVIHQKFGSFIVLGTILIDSEVSEYDQPIDSHASNASSAWRRARSEPSHRTASSTSRPATRTTIGSSWAGSPTGPSKWLGARTPLTTADESAASMWQSLSFGANYKSAYCLSVCPAGEDVIGPYLADKKTHLKEIVRPLQEKEEKIYVLKNSDAEEHVAKRFPNKWTKHVGNSLRPNDISDFS